jgi:hypothetical protein
MKRLMVMLATVLTVAVIVVVPALAQDVPVASDTTASGLPGDGLVKDKGPETLPNVLPPPEASPPVTPSPAAPPETTLPEPPPLEASSDVPPPPNTLPPNLGEQKAGVEGEANEAVEEQGIGSDPAQGPNAQEVGSRQAGPVVEKQEIEDQQVEFEGIGKAGIGKAGIGKDEEDDEEDEDGKAGDPKQETEQDADSGDVDQSVDVINTGDNVNLCLGVLQAANTGNAQNAQGVVQDGSEADEVELEGGSSITITPQLIVDCRQIIYQIVMGQQPGAGSGDRNAVLRGGGNVPGFGQLGIGTNRAALKVAGTSRGAGLSKAAARRSLPRTGGGALLGLGAGVLLVAGGLSVRKIFR